MGPSNRSVDLRILVVCFSRQHFKDLFQEATFTPAHVASMDHQKITKGFLKIMGGNSDRITADPRRVNEVIVLSSNYDGFDPADDQMFNPLPLNITVT